MWIKFTQYILLKKYLSLIKKSFFVGLAQLKSKET